MSLTKVSYSMISGDMLNIKDYGAIGDGVANDNAAWVAFIADCVAQVKTGYIPSGTYLIDPMQWTAEHTGLHLVGAVFNPQNGNFPAAPGPGTFGLQASVLKLRTAAPRFMSFGHATTTVYQMKFENFHMDGGGLAGVVHYYSGIGNVINLEFIRCGIYGAVHGTGITIHFDGALGGDQNFYSYCDINGKAGHSTIVPLNHVRNNNSNAFRVYFDYCHVSNALTLFYYAAGSCSVSHTEVFGAVNYHFFIESATQDFIIDDVYTEQDQAVFFHQQGAAGVHSNRWITISRCTINAVNGMHLNCQQPVRITALATGGDINISPMPVFGIMPPIFEGVTFLASAQFTGSGYPDNAVIMGDISNTLEFQPDGMRISGISIGHGQSNIITNTALGKNALTNITSGTDNTVCGYFLQGDTISSGSRNSLFGSSSFDQGAGLTGNDNVGVGRLVGRFLTSGSNNILLGNNAGGTGSPSGNITTASNNICIGDDGITNAYVKVAWTVTSDARDKVQIQDVPYGLSFITKLKPIQFKFDDRSRYWIAHPNGSYDFSPQPDGSKVDHNFTFGFKAQDIIELEKSTTGHCIIADDSNPDLLRITETKLIPVLVNAIQELKAEFDAYKASHP